MALCTSNTLGIDYAIPAAGAVCRLSHFSDHHLRGVVLPLQVEAAGAEIAAGAAVGGARYHARSKRGFKRALRWWLTPSVKAQESRWLIAVKSAAVPSGS